MVDSAPAYEWIFSGIGVAAASAVAAWLYRRSHPVGPKELTSQAVISNSTVHGPVAGRDISIGMLVQHAPTPKSSHDENRAKPTEEGIAGSIQKNPFFLRGSTGPTLGP